MIRAAATGLIRVHGFARVSLAQIAAEVGISAPALYRHFRSKDDLLRVLLEDELGALSEAVTAQSDAYEALAGFAAEHTAYGVLWERERPKVAPEIRQALDHSMAALAERITTVTTGNPALTRAMLAVVESTTYYPDRPNRAAQRAMLHRILTAIGGSSVPMRATPPPPASAEPLLVARPWLSRRQAILILAPQLTQDRGGYDGVTMEDLGAAAGMSGAAAYHYFNTKAEVFKAAFTQAVTWGQAMLEQAWAAATSPDDMLDRVLTGSVRLTEDFPAIIRTALNNTVELPEPERTTALAAGAEYLGEWQRCLGVVRPDLDKGDIEVLTYAVLAVIGELAGTFETADVLAIGRRITRTS